MCSDTSVGAQSQRELFSHRSDVHSTSHRHGRGRDANGDHRSSYADRHDGRKSYRDADGTIHSALSRGFGGCRLISSFDLDARPIE